MERANVSVYENPEIWANYGGGREDEKSRVSYILDNIPPEATIIADIGCGSGAILNELQDKQAIGIDGSLEALRHVLAPRALGEVSCLPLKSDAFDLVVSCEVLEHLPSDNLTKAVDELFRISRRYLLVTVPCRENLSLHTMKCPNCGNVFHRNGHLNSFDRVSLEGLFTGRGKMRVIKSEEFGPPRKRYREKVIAGFQRFGLCYGDPTVAAICPSCACTSFPQPSRLSRQIRKYARKIAGLRVEQQANWLFLLLEKAD